MTGDEASNRFEPGGLLIEGDRIAWVGPREAAPEAARGAHVEIMDARRSIVMPGFINAHMHSNESFEQGAYDNLPLELWLVHTYPPFGMPRLTERDEDVTLLATTFLEEIVKEQGLLPLTLAPDARPGARRLRLAR